MEKRNISEEDMKKVIGTADRLRVLYLLNSTDKEELIAIGILAIIECNAKMDLNKNNNIVSKMGIYIKKVLLEREKATTPQDLQSQNISEINDNRSINNLFYSDDERINCVMPDYSEIKAK